LFICIGSRSQFNEEKIGVINSREIRVIFLKFWQDLHQLKASLHYSDYRSKLVHFEARKNIFYVKKALA
jgi:hypothetical protein